MGDFLVIWEQRAQVLAGLAGTLELLAFSGAVSLLGSFLLLPALISRRRMIAGIAACYVDAMRCTPFLLLAYIVYFALPLAGVRLDNWWAGALALCVYNIAYMAELLRGAWAGLPGSLIEAGKAYGFTGFTLLWRIVLPPVIIDALPLLGNQLVQIVKDSAFLTVIAVTEITHEMNGIQATYFIPFASFVTAIALYWAVCLAIEGASGLLAIKMEARRA
jgi:polar amino acid transport system permease protein